MSRIAGGILFPIKAWVPAFSGLNKGFHNEEWEQKTQAKWTIIYLKMLTNMPEGAAIERHFQQHFGEAPSHRVVARGRINLIGEHTDYNEGWVMPAAIDKGLFFAAHPNNSRTVHLLALDIDQSGTIYLDNLIADGPLWLQYIKGICDQFQQRGYRVPGFACVFGGNLPVGAGMSSSAALETGFATLLNEFCHAGLTKPDLARLAKRSSNDFVGIPCGIMDQFASLMGETAHFIQLDCRSLNYRLVPADLPPTLEWVLINSRVSHELANSEYPIRVRECQEGVRLLQAEKPEIKSLRDVSPVFLQRHRDKLPPVVYKRCHFVVTENERVQQAVAALAAQNWAELGQLLLQTHTGLRDEYEVSCDEVDFLVAAAAASPVALGARIMGGGFGSCSLNLLYKDQSAAFLEQLLADYEQRFGQTAEVYSVRIAAGTRPVTAFRACLGRI